MTEAEERGSGLSTAMIVAGGLGCLALVVFGVGAFFFLGARTVSVAPPPSSVPAAPAGWDHVDVQRDNGVPTLTILSGPDDGSSRELRLYWQQGAVDESRSGIYDGETRERPLTPEEIELARVKTPQ